MNVYLVGSGSCAVIAAGKTWNTLLCDGPSAIDQQDALSLGSELQLRKGVYTSGGNAITAAKIKLGGTAINARTLDLSGSTITLTASGTNAIDNSADTNLTVVGDASTTITTTNYNAVIALGTNEDWTSVEWWQIKSSGGTNRPQFTGDGAQISELKLDSAGGQYFIDCNLTIGTLTKYAGTPKLLFTAGDTLTVGAVNCNGTAGNLIIVDLYTGSGQHTLAKSGGGTIGVDYWNIQDSIGSPGSTFYAGTHSTNSGNNTDWTFTDPPSGGQTITLTSGIASAETFGGLTLSPGAVTLSLSGLPTAEAFGAATVTPGSVAITLAGIASAEALGTPALNQALNIILSSIASAEAVGSPVLTPGAVDLILSGLPSETAFGALAVQPGAVAVLTSGIASGEAFGAALVAPGSVVLLPSGIPTQEAIGDLAVFPGAVVISPAAIPSLEQFGNIILIGGDQILGYLIAEQEARAALAGTGATAPALESEGEILVGLRGRVVTGDV
jgi:hypothetical protein